MIHYLPEHNIRIFTCYVLQEIGNLSLVSTNPYAISEHDSIMECPSECLVRYYVSVFFSLDNAEIEYIMQRRSGKNTDNSSFARSQQTKSDDCIINTRQEPPFSILRYVVFRENDERGVFEPML